jgi:integrase
MASLYQRKNGIYYLSVVFQGCRSTKSLETKSEETAKALVPYVERKVLDGLINGKQKKDTPFKELVSKYLKYDHNWSKSTLEINTLKLTNYLRYGLPLNKTTKAMTIRIINGCNRWGVAQGYLQSYQKIPGGSNYDPRTRVYTKKELDILFNGVTPHHFNQFIQFAYYSGARIGEIRRISTVDVLSEYIVVDGKSGRRTVKLASQARKILDNNPQWNYTKNYVQLTWSRNRKRLGLKNARMHDLRRTFGYNLIKQGRPIYEVSKLLGHSSVVITEKHYAPLMATDIEDFIL